MINKVILIGNLGGDPEVRHLESGAAVAKFSVATNENYRDKSGEWQTQTEWHNVVAWRHNAERAERDLKKGSMVFIEGKLTHRKWQDGDGNNRYVTEVVAAVLRPLDRRDAEAVSKTGYMPSAEDELKQFPPAVPATPTQPAKKVESFNDTSAAEDDLPF